MQTAVVIPCYKVREQILKVINSLPYEVSNIIIVDDKCPQETGSFLASHCKDPRIKILYHQHNKGVGGATKTGYLTALELGADIIVKIDGDGQMDATLIPKLIEPIITAKADYVKGNRFYYFKSLRSMPLIRLIGNSILSFVNKASSGYWNLMDPTNGFTAIHRQALELLPLDKIDSRYFFESDMLFRLNTIRAVVSELPMDSSYGEESSALSVSKTALAFPLKYLRCFIKRLAYSYFIRDFNACSLMLLFGFLLTLFGTIFGACKWSKYALLGIPAPTGTIMIAVLPLILGFQLLIQALTYDVANIPKEPLQKLKA